MSKTQEMRGVMFGKLLSCFLFFLNLKNRLTAFLLRNRDLLSKCQGGIVLMGKKYVVNLSRKEREYLESLISTGKCPAYRSKHAMILLNADVGGADKSDKEIAFLLRCHRNTVSDVRRRFVEHGLEAALGRRKRGNPSANEVSEKNTYMIAAPCLPRSSGCPNWQLQIVSDKIIRMDMPDIQMHKHWTIPYKSDSLFVANMEDILAVYQRPFDFSVPVICMDEQPLSLIGEKYLPEDKQTSEHDYEYTCTGKAEIFMFTEPLTGFRRISIHESKKGTDWAYQIRILLEQDYPSAEKIILICDKYSAHSVGALYEAFKPELARRLAERLEIHYVPKHGTWLNLAEIELYALICLCFDKRISDIGSLRSETENRASARHIGCKTNEWYMNIGDARRVFKQLYPPIKYG